MPTRQQIHIDRALTNVSVAYIQEASNFIAAQVFPIIPVQKQSDTYFVYNKDDFFRDEAQLRAKGTESAGGDYDIETAEPYFCKRYAFHQDVTEEDRVNADDPLQPNTDATIFVTQKLLIRREVEWATKYFKSGVWTEELTGSADGAGDKEVTFFDNPLSNPIKVFTDLGVKMAEDTGYKPNTLVLSPYVYNALKNHEDILDRIKYTEKGIVTSDLLATLFEVDKVLVPWAVQNTKAKGEDGVNEFIMGKHALLCHVAKNPAIRTPSAGYIFTWKGLLGSGAFGNRVVRLPMPWLGMDTERVEGEMAFDARVVSKDLGIFLKDVVQ